MSMQTDKKQTQDVAHICVHTAQKNLCSAMEDRQASMHCWHSTQPYKPVPDAQSLTGCYRGIGLFVAPLPGAPSAQQLPLQGGQADQSSA